MAEITMTKTHIGGIALGGIGSESAQLLPDGDLSIAISKVILMIGRLRFYKIKKALQTVKIPCCNACFIFCEVSSGAFLKAL